jgi:hypothetical protein
MRWTRAALEVRLDTLEDRHSGKELIDAIVAFADTLTEEDRRVFQDVLLKRRRPAQLRLRRRSDPPPRDR